MFVVEVFRTVSTYISNFEKSAGALSLVSARIKSIIFH